MKTELDTILEALSTCASVLQAALEDEGAPSFRRDDLSHHPWDGGLPGPRGWYARKAIVGLCQRITTLVQDPFERSQIDSAGFALTASLHTVTQCVPPTVAEIVLASGKNGTSLKELAERTELNETKLRSMMHVLCIRDYFMEKEGGFMAPTRSTRALLPESYVGDIAGLMNAGIAAASMLKETAKLPSDSRHQTPFSAYHDLGVFQWLKENPEELAPFSRAMDTMEKMLDPGLVVDLPIEDFGPNITLVDIGGGVGGLTMQFLKRYPGWKAVLQDQKVVIPQAEAFWRKEAPEIVDAGRVTFLGHSFFEPFPLPPAPEDCPYVFMLKDVIHDWPDDLTTRILKNLLPAALPGPKLMIVNFTPKEPDSRKITIEEFFYRIGKHNMAEIQKPDLPCPTCWVLDGVLAMLGVRPLKLDQDKEAHDRLLVSDIDVLMMILCGARCRNVTDFKSLLADASWKFESKTDYRGATSVIKATRV